MAQIVRSVLLVDYDSLHASLKDASHVAAEWIAGLSGVWLDAIESGDLLLQRRGEPHKRRLLVKRCYADPKLLGSQREGLIVQGFQIVDCPPLSGRERNAAELSLVLDANDLLGHSAPYDEFILLSADTDLTPILFRLRAHNRATAVYAGPQTSNSYKAFADAVLEEKKLVSVVEAEHERAGLPSTRTPPPPPTPPKPATPEPQAARAELSDLVRRIHEATKVPLFSPAAYADLFKTLTEEVGENGYHFQQTAENVAAKLVTAGRNVTKRQVGFVVKGLALKGHAFSNEDKPENLAASFREQVLYLASNADLKLTDREKDLVAAWIGGAGHGEMDLEPSLLASPETGPGAPAGESQAAAQRAKTNGSASSEPGQSGAGGEMEDSILAAIAEAVDVLVENRPATATARPASKPASAPAKPAPARPAKEGEGGADIGSEIQKILATYTQTRQDGGRR